MRSERSPTSYEATRTAALTRRDAQLREFHARGLATGRSPARDGVQPGDHPAGAAPRDPPRRQHGRRKPPAPVPARPAARYASYGDRKPYVVADRLDDLHGPTEGTVTLPAHLDWSGNATYDLTRPARLASMYRTVLNEASSADDLGAWIDGRGAGPALAHAVAAAEGAPTLGGPVPRARVAPLGSRVAWTRFTNGSPGSASTRPSSTGSRWPAATRCRRPAFSNGPARTSTCSRSGSAAASSRPRQPPSSTPTGPPG